MTSFALRVFRSQVDVPCYSTDVCIIRIMIFCSLYAYVSVIFVRICSLLFLKKSSRNKLHAEIKADLHVFYISTGFLKFCLFRFYTLSSEASQVLGEQAEVDQSSERIPADARSH